MAYPVFHPLSDEPSPLAMSYAQFRTAFPAEDEHLEFKQGFGAERLAESAVAFTNSDGGVVLIGVDDSGRPVGAEDNARTRDKIHAALRHTHSLGDYAISPLDIDGRTVVVLAVAARHEAFAQTSNGRVLVRRGTMRVPLVGNELSQFMFRRSLARYERLSTKSPLADVDPERLEAVAGALGIRRSSGLSGRLADRHLVQQEAGTAVLTVAGALCLLPRPSDALGKAFVEITRHPADGAEYDRRVVFDGPVQDQVVGAAEFIADELGVEVVVLGLRRHELPRVPMRVLREALANAVAHRSYELRGTAVRVEIRPDRVEIRSPGLLPPPVTLDTLRDSQAARNDSVLTVLRGFDLAEDKGLGIDLIQDRMRDELLDPPEFAERGEDVVVTLPVRGTATREERAWVREVEARGEIELRDRVLLVAARRGERLTNARARKLLSVGRDEATRALRRLTAAGLLTKRGERAGTTYTLERSLRPPAGLRLSRDALLDTIAEMAKDHALTNSIVRSATGLRRDEVLSLLDELVKTGRLRRLGQKKGTRYVPS